MARVPRVLLATAAICGLVLPPLAGHAAPLTALKSLTLDVPTSDATVPPGPGADAVNGNCLACHSADHMMNQPSLPKETWEEVVQKMITAYKAPISPQDVTAIVDYLASTKGTR
jgi:mono/diheme cytochrome c family protein